MKIYANECSFTYGDELQDPKVSAWPILIANKLNASIYNDAISGGTNQRTVYRTIKNISGDYDLFLIAWTDYSRFTFYKSDNNYEVNFNIQLKHNLYQNHPEFKVWGEMLYKHWYNELYSFKLWLQEIIQLQAVLADRPYLMINTFKNNLNCWSDDKNICKEYFKQIINFDTMNDEQIFDEFNEIDSYMKQIDTSKFYKWKEFAILDLTSYYPTGKGGHILEQGHLHLAELLYNYICLK